jgi:Ran GTPase-activating protein (RanGAP) involved in mRNA processing and transport
MYIGAKHLSDVLCVNSTVVELDLCNNKIGDAGVEAIAKALCANSALVKLDLSYNQIGDNGVEALVQALHSNSTLKILDLTCNKIGNRGAKSLAEALCHNSCLQCLKLSGNLKISEDGVCHLVQALTHNTSIINRGTDKCCGLALDLGECQKHALKCSEFDTVGHKINFSSY